MILYFSATGNGEYIARRIGKEIGDEVVNLFDKIKAADHSQMHSDSPWVVVAPTYAWRIPRIISDWLERTNLSGSRDIYFVLSCGGNIGNSGEYLRLLCAKKNLNYCGCAEIVMPENYIAMFNTPTADEGQRIIEQAEGVIDRTALQIKSADKLPKRDISLRDKVSSGIVNDLFYLFAVNARKFYATDGCISCGKCVDVCPLKNISIKNGKPSWGKNCTHCMACISRCPKEAIEYGKRTKGLPRYTCTKQI